MRRWFIALLVLLVTAQLSWAGAALCCVDELAGKSGNTTTALVAGEQAHGAQAGDKHPACEAGHCHCHHAGCATPLAERDALVTPRLFTPAPAMAARLKSHIPAGLERPNWLRA
ncbi:hypothetical protein ACG04R_21660 [Roseateles sp. BYS78W]|uniref:DUF2946 domain-containing protein n=1 Tax=Pelomonas candidula TaxID=3299025 RepID=A0ABW7HHB3_9BURK